MTQKDRCNKEQKNDCYSCNECEGCDKSGTMINNEKTPLDINNKIIGDFESLRMDISQPQILGSDPNTCQPPMLGSDPNTWQPPMLGSDPNTWQPPMLGSDPKTWLGDLGQDCEGLAPCAQAKCEADKKKKENMPGHDCEGLAPCEKAKCEADKKKKENMPGSDCASLPTCAQAKCEADKKKKENMPGSDCASLPPQYQKECYAKKKCKTCPILKKIHDGKACSNHLAAAFGIDLFKKDLPKHNGKPHFFAKSDPDDCYKETILVPCLPNPEARRLVAIILIKDTKKPVLHFEGTDLELKEFLKKHPCYCSGAIRYL